ncbi:uncharacterized protein LOC135958463 [Calliphora vicina]|uniref:uncharacterized protein LOC135958463 n=1 Tax=Calliphora vicina TaxID=7373 RepID=UPI00325AD62D
MWPSIVMMEYYGLMSGSIFFKQISLQTNQLPSVQVFCDVSKALEGISSDPTLKTTFTRDGNLLILTKNEAQANQFLKATTLSGICPIECLYHPSLNIIKGVIFAPTLRDLKEDEIKEGLKDQGVVDCKKITKFLDEAALKITDKQTYDIPIEDLHTAITERKNKLNKTTNPTPAAATSINTQITNSSTPNTQVTNITQTHTHTKESLLNLTTSINHLLNQHQTQTSNNISSITNLKNSNNATTPNIEIINVTNTSSKFAEQPSKTKDKSKQPEPIYNPKKITNRRNEIDSQDLTMEH